MLKFVHGRTRTVLSCVVLLLLGFMPARGQQTAAPVPMAPSSTASSSSVEGFIQQNQNGSPFSGSVGPQAQPSDQVMQLSVKDAIQRGLNYNLGLYLSGQQQRQVAAERLHRLADVLPHLNGAITEQIQKINLAVFGLKLPGVPTTVGPFATNDARANLSSPLFDLHALSNLRAANEQVTAAQYTYDDAKEIVVLAVTGNYLLTVADESRLETTQAQFKTAQALYQLAVDQEAAGVTPNIDTLRQRVEMDTRQQAVIAAQTELSKQRIALERAIGLPVGQKIELVDRVPYRELENPKPENALQLALQQRSDYKAAQSQLRAAESSYSAAQEERIPSVSFLGNYGVIGLNPGNVTPSWTAALQLQVPIFQGGKIAGDISAAEALLNQRRASAANLKEQIQQQIQDALLDLEAARQQVAVAKEGLDVANEALRQSQDRFSAGVATSIEVVQAQESVATANDQYVSSLYGHNIAKLQLAHAMGIAGQVITNYLGAVPAGAPSPNPQQPGNPQR